MGTNLTNHSYVDVTLVGIALDGSDSVQCHTDLVTCCSAAQGPDRGEWYFPNGSRLDLIWFDDIYIYERRVAQRVDLRYRNNGDTFGIYRCAIETNAVHSDSGRETVYAGLYAGGGEFVCVCVCVCACPCTHDKKHTVEVLIQRSER